MNIANPAIHDLDQDAGKRPQLSLFFFTFQTFKNVGLSFARFFLFFKLSKKLINI